MFSQKYGYEPVTAIQVNDVSDSIRIRIWNVFYYFEVQAGGLGSKRLQAAMTGETTMEQIVADKIGMNINKPSLTRDIEKYILNCEWYKLYDFIETYLSCVNEEERTKRSEKINTVLEEEKSGYRVIGCNVVPITNSAEITAIENATSSPYDAVNQHISKALSLYADRETPDYDNSIKESIIAVESICCIITENDKATLGEALKKLESKGIYLHKALQSAMEKLYGYTSDESGIRHGGIDSAKAGSEDAKYMLVSCSAFVNYLIEKWEKVI